MAKAALEAINGCNLFGDKGASWSVVYVDIDAHNRNRSIFETMLPRESSSKVYTYFFLGILFKVTIMNGETSFLKFENGVFFDYCISNFFKNNNYRNGSLSFSVLFVVIILNMLDSRLIIILLA